MAKKKPHNKLSRIWKSIKPSLIEFLKQLGLKILAEIALKLLGLK